MDETELMGFLIILVAGGSALWLKYPYILQWVLPAAAVVGAFYLLIGLLSRVVGTVAGKSQPRKDDWYNGAAILLVIILWFAQPQLAVSAVGWVLGIAWLVVAGVFSLLTY
jgi:hypothetical protein